MCVCVCVCVCVFKIDDMVILQSVDNGATISSAAPPEKRTKISAHHEIIELEKERCLMDIENAKLHKEVLLLKKEVLILQKQRLEMSQPPQDTLDALGLLHEMM